VPRLIGDKLVSNRQAFDGLNDVNFSQLSQVRMVYHDRKLKLFLPVGNNAYSTVQYWLDMRQLQNVPELADTAKVSWSGPHTGQSLSAVWTETAGNDNNALYGCEGDTSTGFFIYLLNDSSVYTDVVGSVANAIAMDYRTFYHDFGLSDFEKWLTDVRFEFSGRGQDATIAVADLYGSGVAGLSLLDLDGVVFAASTTTYGTGIFYGTGVNYGHIIQPYLGHTAIESQSETSVLGTKLQVRVSHNRGTFAMNHITAQVRIRRIQPGSAAASTNPSVVYNRAVYS
jgi:hypothetical protein